MTQGTRARRHRPAARLAARGTRGAFVSMAVLGALVVVPSAPDRPPVPSPDLMIMNSKLALLVLAMSIVHPASPGAARGEPAPGLPRAAPDYQGVSADGNLDFLTVA